MRAIQYTLDAKGEPVPATDLDTWAQWFCHANKERIVRQTQIEHLFISTVFLAIDHQFGNGPPILWETMVFGDPAGDQPQTRCAGTREQAEAMHVRMVAEVEAKLKVRVL